MAPKSTAERGKKYRQKHEEVYREKNALGTRNYGQWIIANEERLRAQREKKNIGRFNLRKVTKIMTFLSIQHCPSDTTTFLYF